MREISDQKSEVRKAAVLTLALSVLLFAPCLPAAAQQTGKPPRVGYLSGGRSSFPEAFIQGLRELGYVEGQNIALEFRTTEGKRDRFSDLAAEMVRLKMDVIVTDNTTVALALKNATATIPIVMTTSTETIGTGLITSFARPGGNVTGLTSVTGELGGKLLELLKELVPKLARVATLMPGGAADRVYLKEIEAPARGLGVRLKRFVVRGPEDFEGAFRAMTKEGFQALLMRLQGSTQSAHFKHIAELTVKNRLPTIASAVDWVEAGGLISYGRDGNFGFRRAAAYVDKILKGAKAAELPVEAPMKFELKINLKTAKQIGLTVPPNVLARADKVIH